MIRVSSSGWRRLGLLSLAVLLVGGACSSKGDLVATINGESIYMADVEGPEDWWTGRLSIRRGRSSIGSNS